MSNVKFIRKNGRIIPIKADKNHDSKPKKSLKKQSEFEKAPVMTGMSKGLKYGAMFGAATGALYGLSATIIGRKALQLASKSSKVASEAKDLKTISRIYTGVGIAAIPGMAGIGAISRGFDGALIGTGVGLGYAGLKKLKKKK